MTDQEDWTYKYWYWYYRVKLKVTERWAKFKGREGSHED